MRVIIVGGTGLVGAHCAIYLSGHGYDVTLAARNRPDAHAAHARYPFIPCDYTAGDAAKLFDHGFDAMVFAAGNDIRHVDGTDLDAHWHRANILAIPRFFAAARDAGLECAINIGSFYPQVRPELVDTNSYIRSRHLADVKLRALSREGFRAMSLNASFIVGSVDGLRVPMFDAYCHYAAGGCGQAPCAPAGGVNFISTRSLSEAILGALSNGVGQAAYLVGDENLTFKDYFELYFSAASNALTLPIAEADHPLMPKSAIYWGAGKTLFFEPDPDDVRLLGFRRGDLKAAITQMMVEYRAQRRGGSS